MCRRYKEYRNLENSYTSFIFAKCVYGNKQILAYKGIRLLDMDNSTCNGIDGGIVAGFSDKKEDFLFLLNSENEIVSICRTDRYGFYTACAPLGANLRLVDENQKVINENLIAKRGKFDFRLWSRNGRIWVENTGDFPERIVIPSVGESFFLLPGEIADVKIPFSEDIHAYIREDPEVERTLKIARFSNRSFYIDWIRIDNLNGNVAERGTILKLRVRVEIYPEVENLKVNFYVNGCKVGERVYDCIKGYSICPSIEIDTSKLNECTNLTAEVIHGDEIDAKSMKIRVDDKDTENVLIVKFFCGEVGTINGELIMLFNPNDYPVDLSGWYITDEPNKRVYKQPKLIFPAGTILEEKKFLIIAPSNTVDRILDFYEILPPKYRVIDIEDLSQKGYVRFNKKHDVVVLKDRYNRTIDAIVYGAAEKIEGWQGKPADWFPPCSYLERIVEKGNYVDTNGATDWRSVPFYIVENTWLNFTVDMDKIFLIQSGASLNKLIRILNSAKSSVLISSIDFPWWLMRVLRNISTRGVDVRIVICDNLSEITPFDFENFRLHIIKTADSMLDASHVIGYMVIDNNITVIGNFPGDDKIRIGGIIIKSAHLAHTFSDIFRKDIEDIDCEVIGAFLGNNSTYIDSSTLHQCPPSENLSSVVSPVLSPEIVEKMVLFLIANAKREICIETPLLFPYKMKSIVRGLINASTRGVRIKIILPKISGYRDYILLLREYGIEIRFLDFDCKDSMLIFDSSTVLFLGDDLSCDSATKCMRAGVLIRDKRVAEIFVKVFRNDWSNLSRTGEDYKSGVCLLFFLLMTISIVIKNWRRKRWI